MDSNSIIASAAATAGIDGAAAEQLATALATAMRERCSAFETIAIPGFGNFTPVKTDEHIGINPEDGKQILYPPHISVEFRAGSMLRKHLRINEQ